MAREALCPSGFVTVTLTAPAACAGVVAVIAVLLLTVTLVAAVPPKLTAAPETKLLPLIVTAVPPAVAPLLGEMLLIVGGGGVLVVYVKPLASEALCPSGLVTLTVTAPAACAGVVAVMVVLLVTATLVAALPPKLTAAPETKLVPLMVTFVPPAVDPLVGAILVTVGATGAV